MDIVSSFPPAELEWSQSIRINERFNIQVWWELPKKCVWRVLFWSEMTPTCFVGMGGSIVQDQNFDTHKLLIWYQFLLIYWYYPKLVAASTPNISINVFVFMLLLLLLHLLAFFLLLLFNCIDLFSLVTNLVLMAVMSHVICLEV